MPPGVGYPTRPSGTTGQDLQRLQNSGNPQPSGTSAPLDLLGTGSPPPGSPQPLTSAPSTPGIPTAMPGVDEGITGPSSIQQGNPELSPSTNAIIEGIKAGDPESIQMLDQLMNMIEGQGQDQSGQDQNGISGSLDAVANPSSSSPPRDDMETYLIKEVNRNPEEAARFMKEKGISVRMPDGSIFPPTEDTFVK